MVLGDEVCNFLLTIIVVFFWLESTSLGGRVDDRPGAGGIGTKTNSAQNISLVWGWAELGNYTSGHTNKRTNERMN